MRASVVFYMPNLAGGGIERLTLLLASGLAKAGCEVTILLQSATGELIDKVPSGIKVVSLNVRRTLFALVPLIRFLRREKPSLLVSGFGHNNIVALWAKFLSFSGVPVVVAQHNALSAEVVRNRGLRFSKTLPFLYLLFLRFADGIVAVSEGIADEMAELARIPRERISVIHNPVVTPTFDRDAEAACEHPWLSDGKGPVILGAGRLVEVKGFSCLIDAFAKLATRKETARLIILGEGPLRPDLERKVQELGLSGCVDLPGYRMNPLPYMKRASLFVLSSLYEGFGNVLVEALACGTPVVSTNCKYGPSEILANGRFGLLVPVEDSDLLGAAMELALDNVSFPRVLRARGREFTVEKSVASYIALFKKILTP